MREPRIDVQTRWFRLAAATLSMMFIGLSQYSWTIIKNPLQTRLQIAPSEIQLTFTIFTWAMTLSQPLAGYLADRYGPRLLNLVAGLVVGLGWIGTSMVQRSESLYLIYGLGGIGVGAIYGTAVGTANRWFPDRRGVATGVVAFGFGFGAAVFNPIISWIIQSSTLDTALLSMGMMMIVALVLLGIVSRYPRLECEPPLSPGNSSRNVVTEVNSQYGSKEMIKTYQWWLLYIAFIMTANTGLMVTAQLTDIGSYFQLSSSIIVLATAVFPVTNGIGRIVGGYISDRLGRERTMVLFFTLQAVISLSILYLGSIGVFFVVIVAVIGFLWGPIFTFFPSIVTDYYGRKNSTVNYGVTYTAKGWGGLLGGYVATLIYSTYGGFSTPIIAAAALSFGASLMVNPRVLKRPK